jgi:4-hydroxy-tetrahydrodipicolinate synthase
MAEVVRSALHVATGVIPAVLTPMDNDGVANITLLEQHCRRLLAQGCSSVLILGTTGEANSFTTADRRTILENVIAGGIPADKIMVGAGCCAVGDSVALSRHALSMGVERVLMLPPFYYKNVTEQGIFDSFASTIERVNDNRLRLFLYLIPQMTGIDISVELVERLHHEFPTIVAGLKDSSGNWASTEILCRRLGSSMYVMVGTEALLLRAMNAGASGCISATANVAAQGIITLYDKRTEPNAATLEHNVNSMRAAFEAFPVIPALKTYMALTSGVAAWRNVRPPLTQLSPTETSQLLRRVQELR